MHEPEAKLLDDGIDLTAEFAVQGVELLRLMQHANGRLDLTARFQRHRQTFTPKADQMPVLPIFLAVVIIRRDAFEQRFDTVRLVIADGGVIGVMDRQMLDLHTETAGAPLGAPLLEELQQTIDMLGVRLGEQMRITDSGSNHGLYGIRGIPQACRESANWLYEKLMASGMQPQGRYMTQIAVMPG